MWLIVTTITTASPKLGSAGVTGDGKCGTLTTTASIYKVSYELTSKNGWVKIRSTLLPKRIKLGVDTNQFDATILYAQLQYRLETGAWVRVWEDERFQHILSGRPGVRFLQDHAWVKPLEFLREYG